MNNQIQAFNDTQTKPVKRTCPKCGYIRETAETKCLDCGKTLQSVRRIRLLGILLVDLGIALLAFMIWLSMWMYNTITQSGKPGAESSFTGNSPDIGFIIFIFGLVITVSLCAIAAGTWQIIFGKRNKALAIIVVILGLIFVGTGLSLKMTH